MKRIFDFILAIFLILMTLPIWFVSILIIVVSDPGPVLYRQRRVGRHEKEFYIFKFRTMYAKNPDSCATTSKNDPRIFKGGQFLRKYKIDELPQLLNVLQGSMSLVGPRPTVYEDSVRMSNEQKRRFTVAPGLTGLAQISGNTSLLWGERIVFDLEYLERRSIWLDLCILVKTALLIFTGRADTHPSGDSEWE